MRKRILLAAAMVGGILGSNACGSDAFLACVEPTSRVYESDICVDVRPQLERGTCLYDTEYENFDHWFCKAARFRAWIEDGGFDGDAGTSDADMVDSGADAGMAKANCVPNHPDQFSAPQPVWFGAKNEAPEACSVEIGAFGGRSYFVAEVPAVEQCPLCACAPAYGFCSPQFETIQLQDSACSGVVASTTEFGPPENWDGSCTNNHSVPACLPGAPCMQSVYASALPKPVDEACEPFELSLSKGIANKASWTKTALSCSPTYIPPDSLPQKVVKNSASASAVTKLNVNNSETCFTRPDPWRSCVRHDDPGIHDCAMAGEYTEQVIVYPEGALQDNRACTECKCTSPSGGTCRGSFLLYADDTCSDATLLAKLDVSSVDNTCQNLDASGGVSSKKIDKLEYVSGSCEPNESVPIGDAKVNEDDAITWCCLAVEPEPIYYIP